MNTPEKIAFKRQLLLERTALVLNTTVAEAEALFMTPRLSGFRINQLKVDPKDIPALLTELAELGWLGNQSKLYQYGYSITDGRIAVVNSLAFKDGRIFIQNQASWLPVLALDPQPGEVILDMCAAPGGKGSHVAELTNNQAELWVNDNSRARLFKLRSNFSRLGARYNQQTMYGIDRLPHVLPRESFDKILLDAPCSGEGLMDINRPKDFEYWSMAQIKRLQQLQKKAIVSAWKLLKPGGTLVYSTCTMAPEENEAVVDYLLTRNEDANLEAVGFTTKNQTRSVTSWNGKIFTPEIQKTLRLQPSDLIEAFYVAKITKQHISTY